MRIAVIGAGIGGLTFAAALADAGIPCRVYEQAEHLGEVGAGIQLAPNAVRLLHRLGLADRLRSVGVRPTAMNWRDWADGTPLSTLPLGTACEEAFGAPYYTVHRADLHQALLDLLPAGTVVLGRRCTGVAEDDDQVRMSFAAGDRVDADVVVGADGIHSAVRGSRSRDLPRFSGQTIYRAIVPAADTPFAGRDPAVNLWLGPGRHAVCYPISAGRAVSFAATTPADGDWSESWSATGKVEDLLAAYRGWDDRLVAVLSAAPSVSRWALHDRDPITQWSTGRTTLLGDAAHPMLPFMAQGANQAVEDAVTLAGCLRDADPANVPAGLLRYQGIRTERTSSVQLGSRENSRTFHLADGDRRQERDARMRTRDLNDRAWLYGYDAELALH